MFEKKVSEDLIVAISQYQTTEYTKQAIEQLRREGIPFTSLVLFDGTPEEKVKELEPLVDISIRIKQRINSLPHIWNIMFGVAKLTRASLMFMQGSDMILKEGSLKSMVQLTKQYDIVSPIKIDFKFGDFYGYKHAFDKYTPIYPQPKEIAGFNDSSILIRLDKLPFFPFDYRFAPYQFEMSALGYELWRAGLISVLDPNAVIFHYVSRDIENSPEERTYGSSHWDENKKTFLEDADEKKRWFMDNSIMNSQVANKVGFPCYIYGEENENNR